MFAHDLNSFLLEVISLKGEQENGQWSNAWIGRLGIVINGQGRKESEQENYHGHRPGLEDWAWSSMVKGGRKGNFPERSTTGLCVLLSRL